MKICPICGHENLAGALICAQCGASLTGTLLNIETKTFTDEDLDVPVRESAGTATFEPEHAVRIEVAGMNPLVTYPSPEITFGRSDPVSGVAPDVDLTPFAAYRMGVSRNHAAIRAETNRLYLRDLDSSNGTFLNGQRLVPHQPYILHNGDEVRLGRMVMRIYFG
ncbi:MAG: FHA domain-containing protein [Anaerolineae bacterium]|nr:FHA domain-containing protein [Anaerolineae bacterium]